MNKINKLLAKHNLRIVTRNYKNGHSDILISDKNNNVTSNMLVIYCSGNDYSTNERINAIGVINAITQVLEKLEK